MKISGSTPVERAVAQLSERANALEPRLVIERRRSFATAGLYAWFADDAGLRALACGGSPGLPVYVGQAGATKWPSGKKTGTTLASRVISNHIRGNVRGSTFRWTLAALLNQRLGFEWLRPRRMSPQSEGVLSTWVGEHLAVALFPVEDRESLGALEAVVVGLIDPPLNLDHVETTVFRTELRRARAACGKC